MRRDSPGRRRVLRSSAAILLGSVLVSVVVAVVVASGGSAGAAAGDDEQALAEKFAPVVRLVHQDVECGPGEPYQPSDVEMVLDDPSVALRGPWAEGELVKVGPDGRGPRRRAHGYHLDFPGNPLEAGCDYEEWADAVGTRPRRTRTWSPRTARTTGWRCSTGSSTRSTTTPTSTRATGRWSSSSSPPPTRRRRSTRHRWRSGTASTRASRSPQWDDPKLQVVDGTHPVVHAAAGSHANFYDSALYLGTSAEQGFGCDDTRNPSDDVRPAVSVIPADPAAARAEFPWIAFQGRWGQREESFYNGPTGPNTKDSWTHPISYQEDNGPRRQLRRAGRRARRHLRHRLLLLRGLQRVRGRPQARRQPRAPARDPGRGRAPGGLPGPSHDVEPGRPLRIARRRAAGQVIRAARRMYASRWRLFIGIGFLTVPVSVVVAVLQGLILSSPEVAGVSAGGEGGGVRIVLAALVSFCLLGTSILLVLAATTHALSEIDSGNEVDVRRAYRLTLASVEAAARCLRGVVGPRGGPEPDRACCRRSRWRSSSCSRCSCPRSRSRDPRRSPRCVAVPHWSAHQLVKTAILLATSILLAAAIGPILGTILILLTGAPFPVANVVSGVTFAVLMPYVALTMAYLYFDARVSAELARDERRSRTSCRRRSSARG